jgi:hypothetical protein
MKASTISPDFRKTLSRLARAHHALFERATEGPMRPSPEAVLNLGAGVVFHDIVMRLLPAAVFEVLDAGVLEELASEESEISENLDHLQSLRRSDSASHDVEVLASALIERMRKHLDRTERAIYVPLQRFYPERNEAGGPVPREAGR